MPKPIPYLTDVHSEDIRRRLLSTVSDTLHFYHNPLTSKTFVNSWVMWSRNGFERMVQTLLPEERAWKQEHDL